MLLEDPGVGDRDLLFVQWLTVDGQIEGNLQLQVHKFLLTLLLLGLLSLEGADLILFREVV